MANNNFFEVVPETTDVEAVNEKPSDVLATYVNKARQDGFGETIIERAIKECPRGCGSYEEFLDVINNSLSKVDEEAAREALKQANIRRSIKLEIDKLRDQDVMHLIEIGLTEVYKTTAVTPLELVEECSKTFSKQSQDLYEECRYAVYLCMRSDWVKNAVSTCVDRWNNSMHVKRYIDSYLKKNGVEPENYSAGARKLISYLPANIQQENSPDMYKAFRAVQLLSNQGFQEPANFESTVLAEDTYYNALIDCVDKQTPLLAAEQLATSMTAKKIGLVPKAGALAGRAVSLKYQFSTSFKEAIEESLGESYDDFQVRREQAKAEKLQRKAERDLKRTNERQASLNQQIKVNSSPVRPQVSSTQRRNVVYKDYNPYIPTWLIFTVGGLLLSLLMLLFGKFMFVLVLIGTSVASYGWFCKDKNMLVGGKSPILYIVGGYAVVMLTIAFQFM